MRKILFIIIIFIAIFIAVSNSTLYHASSRPEFDQPSVPRTGNLSNLSNLFPSLKISSNPSPKHKKLIERALLLVPPAYLSYLRTLNVEEESYNEPRGLGGASIIILRPKLMDTDGEFISVLVHELGHVVDLGGMDGDFTFGVSSFKDGGNPIFNNDPSLMFYKICWKNNREINSRCGKLDYVSGYAKTDAFEDFAESFLFYLLHNREFRMMAQTRPILKAKYNFLKNKIFDGKVFHTGRKSVRLNERVFDATLLPFDLEEIGIEKVKPINR